jgi:ubiquitin carboxyl-terminal hydrolase L3
VDDAYGFEYLCVQDAAKVIKARLALYSQSNNFNVMALSGKLI